MPYRCKICKMIFKEEGKAVHHIRMSHSKRGDEAFLYLRKLAKAKKIPKAERKELGKEQERVSRLKKICIKGKAYPREKCYCEVCHVNRSKSYRVTYEDSGHYKCIDVCRDCYKILVADKPESVYYKNVFDGDYESNK